MSTILSPKGLELEEHDPELFKKIFFDEKSYDEKFDHKELEDKKRKTA